MTNENSDGSPAERMPETRAAEAETGTTGTQAGASGTGEDGSGTGGWKPAVTAAILAGGAAVLVYVLYRLLTGGPPTPQQAMRYLPEDVTGLVYVDLEPLGESAFGEAVRELERIAAGDLEGWDVLDEDGMQWALLGVVPAEGRTPDVLMLVGGEDMVSREPDTEIAGQEAWRVPGDEDMVVVRIRRGLLAMGEPAMLERPGVLEGEGGGPGPDLRDELDRVPEDAWLRAAFLGPAAYGGGTELGDLPRGARGLGNLLEDDSILAVHVMGHLADEGDAAEFTMTAMLADEEARREAESAVLLIAGMVGMAAAQQLLPGGASPGRLTPWSPPGAGGGDRHETGLRWRITAEETTALFAALQ